jgi:monothiol glutaredoxin
LCFGLHAQAELDKISWLLFYWDCKMSVIEKIQDQLNRNAVVLYMKGTPDFPQCGFSARVVQVLQTCNIKFCSVNILEDPELREALKQYSSWPTYPQLYVNAELVGGCDIVLDLFGKGELEPLLQAATPKLV